jgi:hypothetical protein
LGSFSRSFRKWFITYDWVRPMSVVMSINLRKLNKEATFLLGTRALLLNTGEITEGQRERDTHMLWQAQGFFLFCFL